MKLAYLTFGITLLLASVASAASGHKVTLPSDLSVGDVQLNAGVYILTVEGKQAVFKKGKESIPVPAVVDKNTTKFQETTLEIEGNKIQAVDIAGRI